MRRNGEKAKNNKGYKKQKSRKKKKNNQRLGKIISTHDVDCSCYLCFFYFYNWSAFAENDMENLCAFYGGYSFGVYMGWMGSCQIISYDNKAEST